jgi:hypothetical protein
MQLTLLKTSAKPIENITLREDQVAIKRLIYNEIRRGKNRILTVAPCSFGKTVLVASLIHDAANIKDKKVLFVVPFICLIDQAAATFSRFEIDSGFIAVGVKEDRDKIVQIATIQSLPSRNISWFDYVVLILDETHILAFSGWVKKQFPLLKQGTEILTPRCLENELYQLGYYQFIPEFEEIKTRWESIKDNNDSTQKDAWETIKKYRDVWDKTKTPNDKIIIGLTATPWRLSKKSIGNNLWRIGGGNSRSGVWMIRVLPVTHPYVVLIVMITEFI